MGGDELLSGWVYIVAVLFVFILGILWILLPFAVFGTKDRLDKLIEMTREMNSNLLQLKTTIESVQDSQDFGAKVESMITAQGGRFTYRVLADRLLTEEECMRVVGEALRDGRLREPEPGSISTLIL